MLANLILLTNCALKSCKSLEMSLRFTTLKTPLSSSLCSSFCLDLTNQKAVTAAVAAAVLILTSGLLLSDRSKSLHVETGLVGGSTKGISTTGLVAAMASAFSGGVCKYRRTTVVQNWIGLLLILTVAVL